MTFEPIAIVGRSCLLPGAHHPDQLVDKVLNGEDLLTEVPRGRWRIDPSEVFTKNPQSAADKTWSLRGGYVEGFEDLFDPTGFDVPSSHLQGLDPLFLWVLHTAREALRDTACAIPRARTGAIFGNLSFPSGEFSRYAESVWLGDAGAALGIADVDARNRFMSGLPAHILARALSLGAGAHALDAACASSLVAIKLACDTLHDRRADVMLAGAVNRADDLFIHVGFCALQAMSKTGRSRPFDADADGLVPAEGAGFVVLKRLDDAIRDGDKIHGVIRGAGLSNDGRARGMLAPSSSGQVRAMQIAYEGSGLTPADIDYVECHATGTKVGDGTEIESLRTVFGDSKPQLGSLKANMGHLITAAGVAGVIKVIGAMARGVVPPTPHIENELEAVQAAGYKIPRTTEPWAPRIAKGKGKGKGKGAGAGDAIPRRAAVSAFGFGGNNAHLLIEEWTGVRPEIAADEPQEHDDIVIVAIGARVGDGQNAADFERRLVDQPLEDPPAMTAHEVRLPLTGLRFPPADLRDTIGQQLMILAAACEATEAIDLPEATAVIIGAQCDPQVARYGARWRTPAWAAKTALPTGLRDRFVDSLRSAGVVGTMPNIPANRLNFQFGFTGASFTVAGEEMSGVHALELAARALRHGEVDAALVGAVDVAAEPVHESALRALGADMTVPAGDAAIMVVMRRRRDAEAKGEPILATLGRRHGKLPAGDVVLEFGPGISADVDVRFGRPHAATGLLHIAAAALCCARGRAPGGAPLSGPRTARIRTRAISGAGCEVWLYNDHAVHGPLDPYAPAAPISTFPVHAPAIDLSASLPSTSRETTSRSDSTTPTNRPLFVLDPVEGATAMATYGSQEPTFLEPAPRLPSISGDDFAPPIESMPRRVQSSPTPAPSLPSRMEPTPAPVAPSYAPPASLPQDPRAAALAAIQRDLTERHNAYMETMRQTHRKFLAMRGEGLSAHAYATPAPVQPSQATPAAPYAGAPSAPVAVPVNPTPPPSVVSANQATTPRATETFAPRVPATPKPAVAPKGRVVAPNKGGNSPTAPIPQRTPTGMTLDRAGLEIHAGGKISEIFGAQFEQQDGYAVQVRMPEPPLLLADRMVGLDAVAGSMKTGVVWTETDIRHDSWYIHAGRIPPGIMIESGQADLLLISYLGIDFENKGRRAYRLLGCDLTYHASPPPAGSTMRYQIEVLGHANHGDVRLFFFQYTCEVDGKPVLTVRNGQAGFFTPEELAASAGILWTPEEQELVENARVDAPALPVVRQQFSAELVRAFANGDLVSCFGDDFFLSQAHVRTPTIPNDRLLLFEEVTHFEPTGGPWGRGYLRATRPLRADDWFLDGHFKNDPCMPGTLMFDACLQVMAFYIAGLGYTVDRDGWRFEPVTDQNYELRCRGQAIPSSRELVIELFVEEVHSGPEPTVYCDLLCTVDGMKAFHARRMGLRLVPDWPITNRPHILQDHQDVGDVAVSDGFKFGYESLIACAWGKPSDAFGPMYQVFDGTRRVPRLPGPPYHFMSRVTKADGAINGMKPGVKIEIEYDVPEDEWYFDANGAPVMPYCVLLEAVLQPCGWLASYVGSALSVDRDVSFRNLDGKGKVLAEIKPGNGPLKTAVEITNISASGMTIIESFKVMCTMGDTPVYQLDTVFGFFPPEALDKQIGLPITDDHRVLLTAGNACDIDPRQFAQENGPPFLAGEELMMVDRIVALDPTGGREQLGFARAEKSVDPAEWFFKSHFFQDPVQPGSLGLEAMLQVLQFVMLERGMAEGMTHPRFEAIEVGLEHSWKYRGQVRPKNKVATVTLEVTSIDREPRAVRFGAYASLWCDGIRIYESHLGMRLVDDDVPPRPAKDQTLIDSAAAGNPNALPGGEVRSAAAQPTSNGAATTASATATLATAHAGEEVIDPATDAWINDHCPTYTIPVVPFMSMVDRIAAAASSRRGGATVTGVRDVQVKRWLAVEGPTRVKTEVVSESGDTVEARVLVWRDSRNPQLSRFEEVLTGTVTFDAPTPAVPISPLADGEAVEDPYEAGHLFHGPLFRRLTQLTLGSNGSTATLNAGPNRGDDVPFGFLNQILLDAATHGIVHDELEWWTSKVSSDQVAYPHRISEMRFHGATPRSGEVRCETRFDGFDGNERSPAFRVQLSVDGTVWLDLRLVEILMPKGRLGAIDSTDRIAFLRDHAYVPGVSLSTVGTTETALSPVDIAQCDWLPGTVADVYNAGPDDLLTQVAVKDHVAHAAGVHPRHVVVEADGARVDSNPLVRYPLSVERDGDRVVVRGTSAPSVDLQKVRRFWRDWFGVGAWPGEDLYFSLAQRFVRSVRMPNADLFTNDRPLLFLANHQVGVESLLFSLVSSAFAGMPTVTLAKAEHKESWIGQLNELCNAYPGLTDPEQIAHFDRSDPASLPGILKELAARAKAGNAAIMVHVEGTRAQSCRTPVSKMSGVLLDLAAEIDAKLVPVRFAGGLPVEAAPDRIEFPYQMGSQDYFFGTPILASDLAKIPYKERTARILNAIGQTGPDWSTETPNRGNEAFAARVAEWEAAAGVSHENAVLWTTLREAIDPCDLTQRILDGAEKGVVELPDTEAGRWMARLAEQLLGSKLREIFYP